MTTIRDEGNSRKQNFKLWLVMAISQVLETFSKLYENFSIQIPHRWSNKKNYMKFSCTVHQNFLEPEEYVSKVSPIFDNFSEPFKKLLFQQLSKTNKDSTIPLFSTYWKAIMMIDATESLAYVGTSRASAYPEITIQIETIIMREIANGRGGLTDELSPTDRKVSGLIPGNWFSMIFPGK